MSRRWILGFSLAAIVVMPLHAAENVLSEVRTALEKWVETRQLIGKTEADWRIDSETLQQTVRLLEQERASIGEGMTTVSTNSVTVSKERTEAEASQAALNAGIKAAQELVSVFENRLRTLAVAFPPPLMDRVGPVLQRLPEDSTQTKLAAAERFQTVVTLLNEIDKFNGAVTVVSEIRKNATGAEIQVETLYLGLAQAYFVDKSGEYAGVGLATLQGWTWEPHPELAAGISRALNIYRNASPADFVGLPVRIL